MQQESTVLKDSDANLDSGRKKKSLHRVVVYTNPKFFHPKTFQELNDIPTEEHAAEIKAKVDAIITNHIKTGKYTNKSTKKFEKKKAAQDYVKLLEESDDKWQYWHNHAQMSGVDLKNLRPRMRFIGYEKGVQIFAYNTISKAERFIEKIRISTYRTKPSRFPVQAAFAFQDHTGNLENVLIIRNAHPKYSSRQICQAICASDAGVHQYNQLSSMTLSKTSQYRTN